jgi:hypothetical protein
LINSAKVKNMATDFRNIPLFIYGYQDKFKALPGDHANVATAIANATPCTPAAANKCALGNGVIDGVWTANAVTDETFTFWQHVRMAGFASGPTSTADANYLPRNSDGGLMGIESGSGGGTSFIQNGTLVAATGVVTGNSTYFSPTYLVCSTGVLGKYAKQLDTTLDDGEAATGSVRVVPTNHVRGAAGVGNFLVEDSTSYIVCMGL